MPIGTAQPTQEEQKLVRYHLIDCLSPNKMYSAGRFVQYCKEEIPYIHKRGCIPFVVGGTYFYINALLYGLLDEPPISESLKKQINSFDSNQLVKELKVHDPQSLSVIHPHNLQRLRRALLISLTSGRPFSSFHREGGIVDEYNIFAWSLTMPRKELYLKINRRTKKMLEGGWPQEVISLFKKGYDDSSPGLWSLGYPEIIAFLKTKEFTVDNILHEELTILIDKISQKTRNFAKKQLTWFNNQMILKRLDRIQAKNTIVDCVLEFVDEK